MAMELDNSFTVPVPPEQAWDVLLDVERIAPCMPGATVDEVDGDVVNGRIKVKVGPVSLTYRGTAKFTERDPDAHMVVVEASGKETRGAGTASATVRASLAPEASGTLVTMHTTMNVTGRPAQFGRGVIVEVGGKLVDQFAANLARLITGDGGAAPGNPAAPPAPPAPAGEASGASEAVGAPEAAGATAAGEAGGAAGSGVDGTGTPTAGVQAGNGAGTSGGPAASAAVPVARTAGPPQEDSLNLVRLVGPALLKRALPVAAAAAGLTLLGTLLWRLRHRRAGKA
jgi:uncharacterized protein